jgi:hypothetical protein
MGAGHCAPPSLFSQYGVVYPLDEDSHLLRLPLEYLVQT